MTTAGITEFAYVTLKEDSARDALNPATESGRAVEYMIDQVLRHPGARHAHWAMAIERPNQLWVFVDWDKVQDHLDYRETEAYASVQEKLLPHVDLSSPTSISHIDPSISSAFGTPSHPTIEVVSLCFPSDISDATKEAVESQLRECFDKALRGPGLCKAIEVGWSVERELDAFKENIHLLRTLPTMVKSDVFHVQAKDRLAKDVAKE